MPLEHPRDAQGNITWDLNTGSLPSDIRNDAAQLADDILSALGAVYVFYYKPRSWLPALQVEAAASITDNPHRLATVAHGLKYQSATASMLEPYPIYLADRTVKALARAIPAFRQVTAQRISERYNGDIGEVFCPMHGYRSEAGG